MAGITTSLFDRTMEYPPNTIFVNCLDELPAGLRYILPKWGSKGVSSACAWAYLNTADGGPFVEHDGKTYAVAPPAEIPEAVQQWLDEHTVRRKPYHMPGMFRSFMDSKASCCWGNNDIKAGAFDIAICQPTPYDGLSLLLFDFQPSQKAENEPFLELADRIAVAMSSVRGKDRAGFQPYVDLRHSCAEVANALKKLDMSVTLYALGAEGSLIFMKTSYESTDYLVVYRAQMDRTIWVFSLVRSKDLEGEELLKSYVNILFSSSPR